MDCLQLRLRSRGVAAQPIAVRAPSVVDPLGQLAERPCNTTAHGLGPRRALNRVRLADMVPCERGAWLEEARIDATLGACRLSLKSVRGGVRCYMAFARMTL